MENTAPLLTHSDTHDPEDRPDNVPTTRSLDELIEVSLENFGCIQLIQSLLVSLLVVFDSQQTLISVFTDSEPSWHCTNATACDSSSNICDLPSSAWSWDGSSHQTIISEWSLECESSFITGLPSTSYFLGCLVGNFVFAALGDSKLGRKNLLFLCCFAMAITATTIAFANNIWVYSVLRFVAGCFRASILTSVLVLLAEKVGKRRRGLVSIIAFICFSLGVLSLPLIAYLNRDSSWRYLYVWTSVPAILYCAIVYFLVSESPRYLFVHGRQVEALKVLQKLSTLNHESLQEYYSDYCLSNLPKNIPERVGVYSSIKNLLKRRWATRRLIWMMAVGTGVGLADYGLLLGVDNLNFNSYLSVTFNGLMDLPAYLLSFILIEKWSRKGSILSCCVLSGLFCILCAVTSHDEVIQLVSELVSLFSACVSLNVLLIFATELFPTTVRNLTTSMVRQAVTLGALFSPVLISAGRKNVIWCYGIFGGAVLCCGFFVICLPETKGVALSDTFDEQEVKEDIE